MLTEYSNKDHYSAPENLKNKGKVNKKVTEKSDIYSFGIIALELLSGKIQLKNMSISDLTHFIAEERKRPKIPETLHKTAHELIQNCWADSPFDRPNWSEVFDMVSRIPIN